MKECNLKYSVTNLCTQTSNYRLGEDHLSGHFFTAANSTIAPRVSSEAIPAYACLHFHHSTAFAIASTYTETTTVGMDLADGKSRGSGDAGSQTQKDVT